MGAATQGYRLLPMDDEGCVRTFERWVAEDGILFSSDSFYRCTYSFGMFF